MSLPNVEELENKINETISASVKEFNDELNRYNAAIATMKKAVNENINALLMKYIQNGVIPQNEAAAALTNYKEAIKEYKDILD